MGGENLSVWRMRNDEDSAALLFCKVVINWHMFFSPIKSARLIFGHNHAFYYLIIIFLPNFCFLSKIERLADAKHLILYLIDCYNVNKGQKEKRRRLYSLSWLRSNMASTREFRRQFQDGYGCRNFPSWHQLRWNSLNTQVSS